MHKEMSIERRGIQRPVEEHDHKGPGPLTNGNFDPPSAVVSAHQSEEENEDSNASAHRVFLSDRLCAHGWVGSEPVKSDGAHPHKDKLSPKEDDGRCCRMLIFWLAGLW